MARDYLPEIVKTSVVVHTRDGKSITGVLVGVYRDSLALAHAKFLLEDGRKEPLVGDAVIPRENVSFVQASTPE